MKPRSIRFTAWKARAIRCKQAWETRRIVKLGDVQQQPDGSWWPVGKRGKRLACPYGEPGILLWIQEPWRYVPRPGGPHYELASRESSEAKAYDYSRWLASHLMPFLACDQWIKVKAIRVERIQDITDEGVIAEGVPCRESFKAAWDAIHGPGSWDKNAWVWVITFEETCAPNVKNPEKEA